MYRTRKGLTSKLVGVEDYIGDTIEGKVRKIVERKEPITDGAPLIYTERKDGVQPSFNIRTDRFEVAVDAMDAVHKSHIAKREARAKVVEMNPKKDGGAESIQVTGGDPQN